MRRLWHWFNKVGARRLWHRLFGHEIGYSNMPGEYHCPCGAWIPFKLIGTEPE